MRGDRGGWNHLLKSLPCGKVLTKTHQKPRPGGKRDFFGDPSRGVEVVVRKGSKQAR